MINPNLQFCILIGLGADMANLPGDYVIPLKVITARLNHMKINLNGIMKKIEKRAIHNHKLRKEKTEDIQLLLSWDDWIYAALDVDHELRHTEQKKPQSLLDEILAKQESLSSDAFTFAQPAKTAKDSMYEHALNIMGIKAKKPSWADNLQLGEHIPQELLNRLPVTTGELVTLGNWMLTKNVYRFEDIVINELLKTGFSGVIPNYIVNLPDISIYIQTDNAKLYFDDAQVVGVIFCVTELCQEKVLVSTLYLDDGMPRTIVIMLNEDQDIEASLGDFVDEFQQDYDPTTMQDELDKRLEIQKKLINLVLWFSQEKPEIIPLTPENKQPVKFVHIKKDKRLFEATKYKTYRVGADTARQFEKVYEELEQARTQSKGAGKRAPHLRKAHWHLYWYGKKGKNERYDFKLLPITMVGGIPKK